MKAFFSPTISDGYVFEFKKEAERYRKELSLIEKFAQKMFCGVESISLCFPLHKF
jgi:hypothetical protein